MSTLATTILAAVTDPAPANPTPSAPVAPTAAAVDIEAIRAEGAATERARLISIDALSVAGCEALIADAKANGWTPGDTAAAVVAKIKADGMLDAVAALAKSAATVPAIDANASETGTSPTATAPEGPEAWAKNWNASAKLQEEYPTADAYVAVKRRETPAA